MHGGADGLIIYRLKRIGRSAKDLANIADEFQRASKALLFIQNALDAFTPEGKILFNLLAAEHERAKAGRELAETQGKLCHGLRKAIVPESSQR